MSSFGICASHNIGYLGTEDFDLTKPVAGTKRHPSCNFAGRNGRTAETICREYDHDSASN